MVCFKHLLNIIVSETEEELLTDEEDVSKGRNKKKIFSLGYLSKLVNKKIYSDDFDMSFDTQNQKKRKKFNKGSVFECPISEDVESED